ncbi:ATPase family associated with various cellular activities (AAA) [Magnetospirillum fulvum]|uniref:ATPase family associated with various cellular activities (AAA) n=2 Tax=Magnetospirillum fulvum TaxID=1082 RepID=A0A1H6K3Y9_MAGFU|nr:ATPase family associated with various cellular activities (AAA) [Magnetospirillum fulvum]
MGCFMAMGASDVIELVEAALAADYTRVRRLAGKIATALSEGEDKDAAKKLRSLIRRSGVPLQASGFVESLPVDSKSRMPLVEEQPWPTSPLFLDENTISVFHCFIEDAKNVDILVENGLSTRLSMLLSGAPGTGKSLLAGHIAKQLGKPLYVVRLDSVISSLLGDTAKNVRRVFEFVPSREAVLFLDEMDAVAKLRDDSQELGELKRVVNTVIQGLDSLDDHAIVIGATNHSQLLDPAIWRRFPYKVEMNVPNAQMRADMWCHFLFKDEDEAKASDVLAAVSKGLTGADIEAIAGAARRRSVLAQRELDVGGIAWAALHSSEGRPQLPPVETLTSGQKIELARRLCGSLALSQADAARVIGVTRQAVRKYLMEGGDGD